MLLAVTAPSWVLPWHPINTCYILRSHCRHLCWASVSLVSLLAPWRKRLDLIHLCNNNSSNSCYSMPDPVPKVLLQSSHCSYPLLEWRNWSTERLSNQPKLHSWYIVDLEFESKESWLPQTSYSTQWVPGIWLVNDWASKRKVVTKRSDRESQGQIYS